MTENYTRLTALFVILYPAIVASDRKIISPLQLSPPIQGMVLGRKVQILCHLPDNVRVSIPLLGGQTRTLRFLGGRMLLCLERVFHFYYQHTNRTNPYSDKCREQRRESIWHTMPVL